MLKINKVNVEIPVMWMEADWANFIAPFNPNLTED